MKVFWARIDDEKKRKTKHAFTVDGEGVSICRRIKPDVWVPLIADGLGAKCGNCEDSVARANRDSTSRKSHA